MSKRTPTQKQVLIQREMEVQTLELQARYWRANFELKDFYLKDKAIEAEYKEVLAKDIEAFARSQENKIEELSKEESELITSNNN